MDKEIDEVAASADPDLADVFADIARALVAEDDLPAVLERISVLAVATIHGARHCGITLVEGREIRTEAKSDPVPATVDRIQEETGEGPCLSAIRDHHLFRTGDIAQEERWPEFARRARDETDLRSVLSFRLFTSGRTMGALNLYSPEVDAFSEEDVHVGAVFAAHAAVAMDKAGEVDDLRTALQSRDVISTAKGILMAEGDIDDEQAFEVLRRASQRTNVKLRAVAQNVVDRHGRPVTQAERATP